MLLIFVSIIGQHVKFFLTKNRNPSQCLKANEIVAVLSSLN